MYEGRRLSLSVRLKITVNVFYSTFTNVLFYFLSRFFYFFNVFLIFGEPFFIYDAVSHVHGLICRDVIFGDHMPFNQGSECNRQSDRRDYYGNAALCTIVHRAVKTD